MDKAELRRSLIKARQSIPVETWRHQSDRLCSHLAASAVLQQAQTVLAYLSFRQEPDLSLLFGNNCRWGFPRCEGKVLHWHGGLPFDQLPLQQGAYGIREPHPTTPTLSPDEVDLILVPAVACDVRGYRLGYGAGFYDRMLSQPVWASKPTIGILFEFARLPSIPADPWDQLLDGICTEAGLFLVSHDHDSFAG